MSTASSTYDIVVFTTATIDLQAIVRVSESLSDLGAKAVQGIELYGRSQAGEIVVLFRFSFSVYSSALRRRMEQEAVKLKGRLLELNSLPPPETARFAAHLASFDVRPPAKLSLAESVNVLREKMGLGASAEARRMQLRLSSAEELSHLYQRFLAEGSLFIPSPQPLPAGTSVVLLLVAPGLEPMEAKAKVIESTRRGTAGLLITLEPGQAYKDFMARKALESRVGRSTGGLTGSRQFERFETCLQVGFNNFPDLALEFGSNISSGGMFVKTNTPPPFRSRVQLRVNLPDGEVAEVEAEVVHVVTAEQAKASGALPGVGLCFVQKGGTFDKKIGALLDQYRSRLANVLLVDDNEPFRKSLQEALAADKLQVSVAGDAVAALKLLGNNLFSFDCLVLNAQMANFDAEGLLGRIRQLGGNAGVRVLALASGAPAVLAELKARTGAADVLDRQTPVPEMVTRIKKALGR